MYLPRDVQIIIRILNEHGKEAYVVGGCVRDSLLNNMVHDWDITTSATPDEIKEIFKNFQVITTGIKHGTVTVLVAGTPYEITTFRQDGNYEDHRHPDQVLFTSSLIDDLKRRDFTINAMVYHSNTGVIDPYAGAEDLKNKLIRAVGNPNDRFKEDALRILRALRFSIQLGFDIEENTSKAMLENKDLLNSISKERITAELYKMLQYPIKDQFLKYKDIIGVIIPELIPTFDFDQRNKYHIHNVYEHMLYVVDGCKTDNPDIKFAALLHDIGKPKSFTLDQNGFGHFYGHPNRSYEIATQVLQNDVRLSKKQMNRVLNLVLFHDMVLTSKKAVKKALNKLDPDFLSDWFILKQADIDDHIYKEGFKSINIPLLQGYIKEILSEESCFSLKDLAINGNDLIAIGYKQGKIIGQMLNEALQEVMNETILNEKEALLQFIRDRYGEEK